jgi:hypothetical protein
MRQPSIDVKHVAGQMGLELRRKFWDGRINVVNIITLTTSKQETASNHQGRGYRKKGGLKEKVPSVNMMRKLL